MHFSPKGDILTQWDRFLIEGTQADHRKCDTHFTHVSFYPWLWPDDLDKAYNELNLDFDDVPACENWTF